MKKSYETFMTDLENTAARLDNLYNVIHLANGLNNARINVNKTKIDSHESQLTAIEASIIDIQADIELIKTTLGI